MTIYIVKSGKIFLYTPTRTSTRVLYVGVIYLGVIIDVIA